MDTSTPSHTDAPDIDLPASLTSALHVESAKPGLEWLTRLIAPLTGHSSVASGTPGAASTAIPLLDAVKEPLVVMQDVQQPWTGQPTIVPARPQDGDGKGLNIVLLVFIPILAVVATLLLGMVVFLVVMLYLRKKRGIK